jgi:hypothetical protein
VTNPELLKGFSKHCDDNCLSLGISRQKEDIEMDVAETSPIRRRADGSIDIDHYLARGLSARSDKAVSLCDSIMGLANLVRSSDRAIRPSDERMSTERGA